VKINEIFYSVQGEIDVGVPSIFIRLQGCNMNPKCSFCDSSYSWNEGKEMTIKQIIKELKKYPCKNLVITGGEPTLQIKEIKKLKEELHDYSFRMETNGLIFLDFEDIKMFDLISISPKRQNYSTTSLIRYSVFPFCRFKFVYEKGVDMWWEEVEKECMINKKNIWIMPEGKTKREQEEKMDEVIEYCKEKGYNFTPRLHTLVWGNKRAK